MNKKLTTIGATIALGGVMLSASAYAAIAGTSGYDVYKQAIFNTSAVHSVAPQTTVTVKDNGNLLVKVDDTAKVNKDNESMSNSVTVALGDQLKKVDIYRQDEKMIIKTSDSDVYNVMSQGEARENKEKNHEADDPSRIKDLENVADALVGNIQNYITLNDNSDGTKEVNLELADNQIPPVVNAAAALALKHAGHELAHKGLSKPGYDFVDLSVLQDKLPKLVNNIKVSQLHVDAKITKDNLIGEQKEELVITGTDVDGKTHSVEVKISTVFSGYNNTTPDTVDLTGKQVNEIQHPKFAR